MELEDWYILNLLTSSTSRTYCVKQMGQMYTNTRPVKFLLSDLKLLEWGSVAHE